MVKRTPARSESVSPSVDGRLTHPPKTFCEFFAGIGLVREALQTSDWNCVYANDIDPKKIEMYNGRFGPSEHVHLEDVRKTSEIVSRIDDAPFLATASFPCIDLSLAGHWKGFQGEHSSTFFGFADILSALGDRRPRIVLLENVVGFITSNDGKDLTAVATRLSEMGYQLDAFVVDARFFEPQSRPRVFVVCVHESIDLPFAARKSNGSLKVDQWTLTMERRPPSLRPRNLVEHMRNVKLKTRWIAFDLRLPTSPRRSLVDVIDLSDDQDWWDEAAVQKHHEMMSDRHRIVVDEMLERTAIHVGTIFRRKRYGKTRAEVRFDDLAGCLRTPRGGSARQIVIVVGNAGLKMRWMSAREYARLQGADDYPLVTNTIQNLYGFGDAVCVPVVRWVDQQVLTPVFEFASRPSELGAYQ
jgi:DNA (cytosine-5)-methyltransferase 1